MSDTPIPLAGVMGHPVAHSASPRLHGYWLRDAGLTGHYVPLDVAPDDLAQVLAALPRAGFRGVNVTIPHKEAVVALADSVSATVKRVGAANTLSFTAEGLEADNTDGQGFLNNLWDAVPGWRADAGPVAVLGAGGAARAVVDALVQAGAPEIRLANRTRARAEALAAALGGPIEVLDWSEAAGALEGVALAVNTTALGMDGQGGAPVALDALPAGAVATDIVYTPLETPFLQGAAARGARTVDGLGMLLHQAVPGFARWFGQTPQVTAALRAAVLA